MIYRRVAELTYINLLRILRKLRKKEPNAYDNSHWTARVTSLSGLILLGTGILLTPKHPDDILNFLLKICYRSQDLSPLIVIFNQTSLLSPCFTLLSLHV
jgi:hypothetical protein